MKQGHGIACQGHVGGFFTGNDVALDTRIDVELLQGQGRPWSKVPLAEGWERVIVNNSCPKGLVEDLNEMKAIKAGIEKTKNAYPNVADMVRKEGFRRN